MRPRLATLLKTVDVPSFGLINHREIAPSTTKSKYTDLSMATHELLTPNHLLMEIHQHSLVKISLNKHLNTTKNFELREYPKF